MIKKSLLLTLLLAILAPWAAQAQETLTVYDGTNTNSNVPFYGLYADTQGAASECVIPADELTAMTGGTISAMKFYIATAAGAAWTGTHQVYLGEVDATTLTGITGPDAFTVVATASFDATGTELTIEFDEPYTYGGGNLLIGTYVSVAGNYKSAYFYGVTQTENTGRYRSTASGNGNAVKFLPKTTFTYEAASTGCVMPTAIAVSDITHEGAVVTWEGDGDTWNLRYKASTDDDYTMVNDLTETSYTLSDLDGNTAYSVGVQTVCSGSTSNFKSTSFTTMNPCAVPTNLQVSDITASSATLTWTAGYQETNWTVKYKKSADAWDNANVETVNGTPSIVLSSLDGLTTYNVQVYNCENYVSANFTTAAGIPLTEAFATSSAPAGWTRYNALLSTVMDGGSLGNAVTSGWNFSTGNGVFDNHAKVNIYGSSCKYWLVTPTLPMEDNVQLTFDLALTKYSGTLQEINKTLGQDDRFVVLITTDGGTTWEILREWNNTGSEYVYNDIVCSATGQAVAIDLSSYAGQSIAVAFYGESTVSESGSDNNLHIDNVSIDYIPACAKPTGLAASDVTAHEATITWTSDATAWQVQLDDEDPIDVEEASYTFENLDPETTYTAKVRANCDGTYSEWTTTVSFTTTIACPAPTNLTVTPNALTATFTWESNAGEWEVAYATDATAEPEEFIVGTVNEATYTVNDLELGDYYFWVRANCGDVDGDSQWAGPASVHIGYCVPNPSTRDGKGITKVIFGTGDYLVNNVDETNGLPAASPFYGDYSSMVGAMQAGVESTISITYATGSGTVYSYGTIIWVDWDNSLSFEDSEIVYTGTSAQGSGGVPQVLEASFTVPGNQATGQYRMRIAGADSYFDSYIGGTATGNHSACFSSSYAVCHDYTLRVLEAPSCLTPTDLAINYTGGLTAEVTWEGEAETYNIDVNGEVTEGVTSPYVLDSLELATTYAVKVQADCGEDGTSEWSNPVSFTTDLCLPENQCAIYYSFTDQYDDSWNGAYINIVDATTQEVLYELTMPNVTGPYEGSFNVCDGREIQFVWVSGSYPRECGYVFTHFGTTILEKATNSAAPDAGVFFTYEVNCTPDPCTVPYELMSSNVSYNQATLSWTGYSDTYYVQYRTAELRSGDWTEVTANTTTLDLTGLVSETTYEWQVRTDCDSIVEWSEIATFTTQEVIYWNDSTDWTVPEEYGDVTIPDNTTVLIPAGYTAIADEITIEGDGQIIMEPGAQLYHSNEIPVTVQMQNIGYSTAKDGNGPGGFRLIASPITPNVGVASTGLTSANTYDLYSFDQSQEYEWRNYKTGEFNTLNLMQGYLYASDATIVAMFAGQTMPTDAELSVDLEYVTGAECAGWNLLGNPFTCTAYINREIYTMNDAGNEILSVVTPSVEPMQGFFVQASGTGESVTFTTTDPGTKGASLVLNLSQGRSTIDRAIVRFGEGSTLSKFQLNPNHTKVYIPMNGKDYAVVTAEEMGEMPVNFKAEKNGSYTMSFTAEEVNFNYLHLIDNMTGADVDLLATPSYTFNAQTTDYATRFRLVFATGNNSTEDFAFFSNGNLVINNEGNATLQVVDVMGRILSSETINGSTSINLNDAAGVYMIRLINGENVKVQKVIIK